MRIIYILFLCAFLLIFVSCATIETTTFSEIYKYENSSSEELVSDVILPSLDFFASASYMVSADESSMEIESSALFYPQIEVPYWEKPEPEVIEAIPLTFLEPDVLFFDFRAYEPLAVVPIKKIVAPREVSVVETVEPVADVVEPIVEPFVLTNSRDLFIVPDEEIRISLEGVGWIFDSLKSEGNPELKERVFTDSGTEFLFGHGNNPSLKLFFILQNHETGDVEEMIYNLSAEEDMVYSEPVVINSATEVTPETEDFNSEDLFLDMIVEENVPGVVASFDNLVAEETGAGSDVLKSAFDLLERQGGYNKYLVDLAESSFRYYPYDNLSAEMLYKAAQALETPGVGQDIEQAVGLFKLVRDYFPLSLYSDQADERIAYLERHFMRIY